jgi:hypothetical protein
LLVGRWTGPTFASFSATTANSNDSFAAASDWVAPAVSATVIAKTAGGTPGFIHQGGTYRVYAIVTDSGNPPSGVSTVKANVDPITTGQTSVTLVAGSFTIGGVTYDHRSASLTANASLAEGTYTYSISCTDVAGNSGTQSGFTVVIDNTAPTVVATVIAKTAGGVPGYIKQGGTYQIYAQVTDASAGVASVTADVSSLTSGQTARVLTAGSYSVGGVSYNYRSASTTAGNPLLEGTYTYSVTPTDNAGNAQVQTGYSVTVDDTAPAGVDVQVTNGGATLGQAEQGDVVTLTFDSTIDPDSVLSGWTGPSTTVTVRLNNNAVGDKVLIYNSANTSQLPLGTITLGRTDYVTVNRIFTSSTMVQSGNVITITLGTASGATTLSAGTGIDTWVPSASATDYAGNACSIVSVIQSGAPAWSF